MNCKQAIEYIHSLEKFGIKPGLERIAALCDTLGNPQKKLKIIHVAGTNGKGSTSTVISNILRKSGYTVGLYTSPYVVDFRERIVFNGGMIAEDELAFCVQKVKDAAESLEDIVITEFEFLTAVAFVYYEMKRCDFVVLEVGLGGRFDATNVIPSPLVCAIASISLDHMNILGNTTQEIAFEKCGIIKEGAEVVTYMYQTPEVLHVITKTCEDKNCKLTVPAADKLLVKEEKIEGTYASYDGVQFLLPLSGLHMVYNTCTAIEAVRAVERKGYRIESGSFEQGINETVMAARTELICREPLILLDGGHNEGCANALSAYIVKHLSDKRIMMVSSMMADKDYDSYLKTVAPYASFFIATKAEVPRALSADELAKAATAYCSEVIACASPGEAVEIALSMIDEYDALIVCGSFYLAGEIRGILQNFRP